MSFERLLREMIREEVEHIVAPIEDAIARLSQQGDLGTQLSALLGAKAGARRGPGRPAKPLGARPGRPAGGASGKVVCAVIGCRRPVRSKGYCAAHYQKLRNLTATKRRPADWTDSPKPQTVTDIVLPRGRAGAKALAALNKK